MGIKGQNYNTDRVLQTIYFPSQGLKTPRKMNNEYLGENKKVVSFPTNNQQFLHFRWREEEVPKLEGKLEREMTLPSSKCVRRRN